jgi:hypothetical protein
VDVPKVAAAQVVAAPVVDAAAAVAAEKGRRWLTQRRWWRSDGGGGGKRSPVVDAAAVVAMKKMAVSAPVAPLLSLSFPETAPSDPSKSLNCSPLYSPNQEKKAFLQLTIGGAVRKAGGYPV